MADQQEKPPPHLLQFYPFSSAIDTTFWHQLTKLKLEQIRLNEEPIEVTVNFQTALNANLPSLVNINYESLLPQEEAVKRRTENEDDHLMFGHLLLVNTLESFTRQDKRQLIIDAGNWIWQQIIDQKKKSEVDTNLEFYLSRFLMLVFADLKTYKYHYWCAFPALNYPPECFQLASEKVGDQLSQEQILSLLNQYRDLPSTDWLFFVVILVTRQEGEPSEVVVHRYSAFWSKATIDSLSDVADYKIFFSFLDPSPSTRHPGWPARNYLAYLYLRFVQLHRQYPNDPKVINFCLKSLFSPSLRLLSVRLRRHKLRHLEEEEASKVLEHFCQNSIIYQIVFGRRQTFESHMDSNTLQTFFESVNQTAVPPIVGWERNPSAGNRLQPRLVDLSSQLDPRVLATEAVQLNLQLMKWRLVPSLNLDVLRTCRCLLLGAGTLGCNIARGLMAWGVSQITFIDSGMVSYSNPVRQTLYTVKDCEDLKAKAIAAVEALRLINPGVQAEGIVMSIPMPGHVVIPEGIHSVEADVKRLEQLINDHDVIFLLTDTRESRWLPTLLGASMGKIVLNVALGFDTYLIQRHGVRLRPENPVDQKLALFTEVQDKLEILQVDESFSSGIVLGTQLGCYFCNDVFAPGDTTHDRTLDQQCTVTRPGLSMIASGYAVELLASLLQHPAKALAPAVISSATPTDKLPVTNLLTEPESTLGFIPHQIRGYIARTEQMTSTLQAFDGCTACSSVVIDKYRNEGFNFLLNVFNNPTILEEISGLKERFHNLDEQEITSWESDEEVDAIRLE